MTNSVDICSYSKFACGGCKGVVDVELTDVRKRWLQDHHPQGIVWEIDGPFRLQDWAAEFIELTCLGIHYRIPHKIDGQPTIRKA